MHTENRDKLIYLPRIPAITATATTRKFYPQRTFGNLITRCNLNSNATSCYQAPIKICLEANSAVEPNIALSRRNVNTANNHSEVINAENRGEGKNRGVIAYFYRDELKSFSAVAEIHSFTENSPLSL